jgi:hypothetical protein
MENEEENVETKMEFMRKSRFDSIRKKFDNISPEAEEIIKVAQPNDILKLSLTFNSPIKVVEAEIFDEKKFAELAF